MLLELKNNLGRSRGINMNIQVVLRSLNMIVIIVLFVNKLLNEWLIVIELQLRVAMQVESVSHKLLIEGLALENRLVVNIPSMVLIFKHLILVLGLFKRCLRLVFV